MAPSAWTATRDACRARIPRAVPTARGPRSGIRTATGGCSRRSRRGFPDEGSAWTSPPSRSFCEERKSTMARTRQPLRSTTGRTGTPPTSLRASAARPPRTLPRRLRSTWKAGLPDPLVTEEDQLLLDSVEQRLEPVAVEAQGLPERITENRAGHGPDGQADDQEGDDPPDAALLHRRRKHVVEMGAQLFPQEEPRSRPIVSVLLRDAVGDVVQAQGGASERRPAGQQREERARNVGHDRPPRREVAQQVGQR